MSTATVRNRSRPWPPGGVNAVVDGVPLAIELDDDEQYDAIRDSLVETNARLRRMAPRRHQLTDIFRKEDR